MSDKVHAKPDEVQAKLEELNGLLQKYADLESAAREEVGHLQAKLDDLVATIKVIREPYEARQAMLYAQIQPLAEALLKDAARKSHAFPGGVVKYRSGYIKHSWDSKKLLGYAEAHPEIRVFDTPKEIEPLVTIELK